MSGNDLTSEAHASEEARRSSEGRRTPKLLAAALALVLVVGAAVFSLWFAGVAP
jgi:hypothetical protein